MEPRNLQVITEACQGRRVRGSADQLIRRICTDSRQVQAGDLFVALRGDRFDGHAFVPEAAGKGIAAALVEQEIELPKTCTPALIVVENTRAAYGKMAARYRADFPVPLVAVAGSNGKTTTKELLAAVLRQRFQTLSSPASFNNDIGVPATLLELTKEHQVAVLEFGTNHPGELRQLLSLARPQFGVIPSIGREHLEFFRDLNGVIEEEGSLAEALPPNGKLFINADTSGVQEIIRRSAAPVVTVGLGPHADWRAENLAFEEAGMCFAVRSPVQGFTRPFRIALLGRHQVVNALLAIAVAAELGLSADEIQRGLLECRGAKMRLQLWKSGGVQVLDDAYNANADSMRAALETLRDFPCRGRRVAVLGDMAELGDYSTSAHQEIGVYAARMGVQKLFAVGTMAAVTAQAAQQAGLREIEQFADVESAARALKSWVRNDDVVLLKASRAAALERIADVLRKTDEPQPKDDFGQG